MTHALAGRKQSAEHARKRVAAVACARAAWTPERREANRLLLSANNGMHRPEVRAKVGAALAGRPAWNKGKRLRAPGERRATATARQSAWREKNRERANAKAAARHRRLRAEDVAYKTHLNVGRGIRSSLGREKRRRGWEALVGYTTDQLVDRLLATMPPGFTLSDYFAGKLHIDHIRPVSSFTFASAEDAEFRACWALDNLRLLPAAENLRKGARWTPDFKE